MKNRLLLYLLLLSVPFSLTACGGGETPPPAPVKKQRTPRAKKPVAKAEVKSEDQALPFADGRVERNPFKPFVVTDAPKILRPTTPLQRYRLAELRLVAVIWGIKPPVGMLEAPDGKGYVVKKGDLIGDRDGRVARVKEDSVVVVETFKDHTGKVVSKSTEIKLPSSKERGEAQ